MFKLQMDLYSEFTPTQYTQAHLQEKAIYVPQIIPGDLECLVNLYVFIKCIIHFLCVQVHQHYYSYLKLKLNHLKQFH